MENLINATACILYLIVGRYIAEKYAPINRNSSSLVMFALTAFVWSLLFVAGLFLFDLTLPIGNAADPQVIQNMKDKWYAFPVGFGILFLFSLFMTWIAESFGYEGAKKPDRSWVLAKSALKAAKNNISAVREGSMTLEEFYTSDAKCYLFIGSDCAGGTWKKKFKQRMQGIADYLNSDNADQNDPMLDRELFGLDKLIDAALLNIELKIENRIGRTSSNVTLNENH